MAYGFRRNFLGLKRFGVVAGIAGVIAAGLKIASDWQKLKTVAPVPIAGLLVCAAILLVWLFLINLEWVSRAAEAYAKQLIEAIDLLIQPTEAKPNRRKG